MKCLKITMLLQLILMLNMAANAQQGQFRADLNYTVGLPFGNLKNLSEKTSWRGGEIAFMYGLTDKASIGLQIGMQDFYQKFPRTVIHQSGTDISAVVSNSIQVMPILLKGSMNLKQMGAVLPYVSLAAGGNFIQYRKFYGEFTDSRYTFGFAAQPSVGVHIPFGRTNAVAFHLAAGYNFMPFSYNDADGLSHGVIKAGISVPLQ
ncbi:MAG TPA: hypothetical protein VGD17_12480 [Chitinophagaceae bacterium]